MSRQLLQENAVGDSVKGFTKVPKGLLKAGHLVIEGYQVDQAGPAFHEPMLAGSDPLVGLHMHVERTQDEPLHNFPRYRGLLINDGEWLGKLLRQLLQYSGVDPIQLHRLASALLYNPFSRGLAGSLPRVHGGATCKHTGMEGRPSRPWGHGGISLVPQAAPTGAGAAGACLNCGGKSPSSAGPSRALVQGACSSDAVRYSLPNLFHLPVNRFCILLGHLDVAVLNVCMSTHGMIDFPYFQLAESQSAIDECMAFISQGWRLNHFPGQSVPMLDNPLSEEKFPNIQSKPPLAQLEAISSCPITCYLGEETDPHLSTTSFQAKQPQLPQPLLIRLLLQTLHQLHCPSLYTLQYLNIPLVVGGPKLNTVFEVWPHQCRVQGHDHFPSPAGHAIFDTGQDAIGLLGRLGTLLAHIQAAVNKHPQVLLCWAAFQPLFPKPVALHGVAVAQVQDLALGLVKPHTIHPSPSIQPVQVPLQSLPTLQQINTPTQLGVVCKLTESTLDPFIQIIDKDVKQNWPQHRALGNTACDRLPTGVNSIHHHSLGPAIQPVLYPAKSTPVQAMSSQFLQENAPTGTGCHDQLVWCERQLHRVQGSEERCVTFVTPSDSSGEHVPREAAIHYVVCSPKRESALAGICATGLAGRGYVVWITSVLEWETAQGDGEWGLRSVHHTLSLPLLPPQEKDSSHSSPAPAWGPSHTRQSSTNFSNMSPSHRLQFFTNCSSVGPFHGVQSFRNRLLQRGSPAGHKSCQQTCSRADPSLHRSTGPARSLLQLGLPTGSQSPLGIHLPQHGFLHGLQVDICSTVDLHGLQGDSLPHHGLHHGLQGNLCSGAWSTSSPSFTDLGGTRVPCQLLVGATLVQSWQRSFLALPQLLFNVINIHPILSDSASPKHMSECFAEQRQWETAVPTVGLARNRNRPSTAQVAMNGSRCGIWEPSSRSGSVGTAFGVPGEREPLWRDAVSEELGPTSRGAGSAEAGVILYRSQLSTEVSLLQSQLSWQQRWRRRGSGKMYRLLCDKESTQCKAHDRALEECGVSCTPEGSAVAQVPPSPEQRGPRAPPPPWAGSWCCQALQSKGQQWDEEHLSLCGWGLVGDEVQVSVLPGPLHCRWALIVQGTLVGSGNLVQAPGEAEALLSTLGG
ncbi:hypothetical protein QYF61_008198 [Mycteria americana]|uniref:Uncharacterized protein n=1 Tax=Mycteria americana TaxID=33587 RepID=A0AAN7NNC5_MYCAM|nr:hypothetical protein QYF61_008198 [Mycteria americana]